MSSPPAKKPKMTFDTFKKLSAALSIAAIYGAGSASLQPAGAGWRFFSYHPLLMTLGFVLCMGNGALVKKMGGYTNTKLHGYISFLGVMLAWGGYYVIYQNKELSGKAHLTTYHALGGLACLIMSTLIGMAGSVFIHPDWGLLKTNKLIRRAHKKGARVIIGCAWVVAVMGLKELTSDYTTLGTYAIPLILAAPVVLV